MKTLTGRLARSLSWFFANWLAGAERYRTFEEMILAAHDELLHVLEEERLPSPDASQRMAALLPELLKELQHKIELYRQSMRPKSGEPFVPFLVQYYQVRDAVLPVGNGRLSA